MAPLKQVGLREPAWCLKSCTKLIASITCGAGAPRPRAGGSITSVETGESPVQAEKNLQTLHVETAAAPSFFRTGPSDKRVAIAGAFLDRFAIGFLICVIDIPLPGWLSGLIVALLVRLPSAVVTKAYAPILGMGALGGIIIGILRAKFGH
jgi:hypothetical protein